MVMMGGATSRIFNNLCVFFVCCHLKSGCCCLWSQLIVVDNPLNNLLYFSPEKLLLALLVQLLCVPLQNVAMLSISELFRCVVRTGLEKSLFPRRNQWM